MNTLKLLIPTFALSILIACSSTTTIPSASEMNVTMREITGQDGRACVQIRDISGYGAISDSVLSVSGKFQKQYIMVTVHRCPAIESSPVLAFKGAFSDFCGGGRDSVHAGEGRCPVQSVFEFENRKAAFAAHDKAEELIAERRQVAGQAVN